MGKTRTKLAIENEYVAIDVETTGKDLKWCEIIEVAAIHYKDGIEVGRFSSLARPSSLPIDDFIEELTGITSKQLEDAPMPDDVIPALRDFLESYPLVGHNVCFDTNFIDAQLSGIGNDKINNELIDTCRISRHVMPDAKNHQLSTIFDLCIEDSAVKTDLSSFHRASHDAEAAAFCYEAMKPKLIEKYGDDPEAGFSKSKRGHGPTEADQSCITVTVDEIDDSNPFFGQTICFTGALSSMVRREAKQRAVNLGATPLDGVTRRLNYLVVGSGDFASSVKDGKTEKMKKAEEYILRGVPLDIISEDFFMKFARDAI